MERLKALRAALGETQQVTAQALGVDRTTYAKYEGGANEPNIAMLKAMAAHFEVSVDYLLGLTDERDGSVPLDAVGLYGGPPLDTLSESERAEVEAFARYIVARRKDKDAQGGLVPPTTALRA